MQCLTRHLTIFEVGMRAGTIIGCHRCDVLLFIPASTVLNIFVSAYASGMHRNAEMHRCTWDICLYEDFLNGMHQFCILLQLLHMFFQSHFWGGEMKDCIKIHRNWNMQGPKDQIQDEKIQNRSNSHVLNASDCQRLRLASLCRGLSFHIFHGSRFVNTLQQWKKGSICWWFWGWKNGSR